MRSSPSLGGGRSDLDSPGEFSQDMLAGRGISVYPNPFVESTEVRYRLSSPAKVEVAVFDPQGRQVRTLFSGTQRFGTFALQWDGNDGNGQPLPSGAYFVRVHSKEVKAQSRVILLR